MTPTKRPAEIVRDYIIAEFFGGGAKVDQRLPTIHEFASHLKVSHSTVRSVIRSLAEEGKLAAIPGKGTFLTSGAASPAPKKHHCLGINIPIGENRNNWAGNIFFGATHEALKSKMMVTALDIVTMPNAGVEEVRKALGRVDGVIAFPGAGVQHLSEIKTVCAEENLPLVHINPPSFRHTADFVSNDYFNAAFCLARAWVESGRRRVVLLFEAPIRVSVSSRQVCAAFSLVRATCAEMELVILDGECFGKDRYSTPSSEVPSALIGYQRIRDYLLKHEVDAIFCLGDYQAEGAVRAVLESGRAVPEEVSVIAATGLDDVHFPFGPLSTLKQRMVEIGEAAARMLLWRIRHHAIHAPGLYLMPELSEGATLRRCESEAFRRLAQEYLSGGEEDDGMNGS